ncbi:hypothetical protein APHAL10511_001294 [Amanita phalloides]|nr:hypothetical protein APHAL10511_001294 [Amanita phalloides]
MANPRQRRKARSSSHRPVSLSLRAKKNLKKTRPIRGPKVLQDAWDRKKTVKQNYAALGLVHTLNPTASGGEELLSTRVTSSTLLESDDHGIPDVVAIPQGFGRITRDEAGNVVQITLTSEETEGLFKDSSEVMKETEIGQNANAKWVTNLGKHGDMLLQIRNNVTIEALEDMSVKNTRAEARHASQGEIKYLERLTEKYGNDVEQMARDRKLNNEQRTAGELRRGLRKSGMLAG